MVLLPLPHPPQPHRSGEEPPDVRVEVMLPSGPLSTTVVDLPPGDALLLDGRARWRLIPNTEGDRTTPACPCVCFRYQENSSDEAPSAAAMWECYLWAVMRAAFALVSMPPHVLQVPRSTT
ncbi:MAG: hypothetical protein SGPRY_005588 [Prymnesium sp.]